MHSFSRDGLVCYSAVCLGSDVWLVRLEPQLNVGSEPLRTAMARPGLKCIIYRPSDNTPGHSMAGFKMAESRNFVISSIYIGLV